MAVGDPATRLVTQLLGRDNRLRRGATRGAGVGVWVADAIWFGTDPVSAKGRNLARDERVVVHLESGDEAVIIHGDAAICAFPDQDPTLVEAVDAAYSAKYVDVETGEPLTLSGGPEGGAAFRVTPRRVLAWLEDDFVRSRTR